ncbi:hypothetical protein SAMN05660831_02282 [Thiohalospira halophila DSM 15071]|uniref:Uncharacterized protein n=1 Tax=Thiohalospira halophila DSM 15071 TaxID=1123397 RepID=A0A1I1V1A0_9GAMM|nr:hypothetical protein [Thiohalospira halophila]SFD76659.1 hypothetical protein SAMN05660831_02282 [Thiohalospira halophila DSM 15071]
MEIAESALELVRSTAGNGNSAPEGGSRAGPGGSGSGSSGAAPSVAPSVSAGELPVGANTIVQRNIDLLLGGLTYTSRGGASGGGSSSGNLVDASA